jgi:hypothetical protein
MITLKVVVFYYLISTAQLPTKIQTKIDILANPHISATLIDETLHRIR